MSKKVNISSEHSLKDLTGVSSVMMPLIRQLFGKKGLVELEILRNWHQIVGKELAQYSLPQKITFRKNDKNNGCLFLQVLSGAFATEIVQQIPNIVEKVNMFFGYAAVSNIKIIQTGNTDIFQQNKKNIVNMKKTLVSEQEDLYITELTEDIKSFELRETLQKLGRAVFKNHQ